MTSRHEFDHDDALRAVLAAADPARSLPPAEPAALSSLLAGVMSTDTRSVAGPTRRRTPVSWLVAAAAAVVIAGVGGYAATRGGDDPVAPTAAATPSESTALTSPSPGDSGLPVPGTTTLSTSIYEGRCAAPSSGFVAAQQQAFSATVTAISGRTITLQTSEVYAGEVAQTVQVQAPSRALRALIQGARFEVGGSYLVAASDGMVAPCGLTGKATGDLQSMYEKAFIQ